MGLYGIIIGIVFGIAISYVISVILKGLIDNLSGLTFKLGKLHQFYPINVGTDFIMKIPLNLIALSTIIVYIIVIISVVLPIKKVNKKNKIQIIKGLGNIKRKKVSQLTIIRKLFKQEGELAYKYVKIEKSKHKTITVSITISVAIFLIITGVVSILTTSINELQYDDYIINLPYNEIAETLKELEANQLIEDYFIGKSETEGTQRIKVPNDKMSDKVKQMLENGDMQKNDSIFLKETLGKSDYLCVSYYILGNAYDQLLKKAGLNELKEDECIIINNRKIENSKYGESFELTTYKTRRHNRDRKEPINASKRVRNSNNSRHIRRFFTI